MDEVVSEGGVVSTGVVAIHLAGPIVAVVTAAEDGGMHRIRADQ